MTLFEAPARPDSMVADICKEAAKPGAVATSTVVSLFSGCGGLDLGFRGDFEALGGYQGLNGGSWIRRARGCVCAVVCAVCVLERCAPFGSGRAPVLPFG